MIFKNTNILYALFLVLIPIIIHLVRWKKFKKEYFTNVSFLKELEIKSHKSRKIKEWLILLMRMLSIFFLVIAFAYPYIPSVKNKNVLNKQKTIIYFDNTLSMSASINKLNFLELNKIELINQINNKENYVFLSNDEYLPEISGYNLKKHLQKIDFSPLLSYHKENLKKIQLLIPSDSINNPQNNILYLSDLQNLSGKKIKNSDFDKFYNYFFKINRNPEMKNVSIDSLSFLKKENEELIYKVWLSSTENERKVPIRVISNNLILWTGIAVFDKKNKTEIEFSIPMQNQIQAKVMIDDQGFAFDNELFFTYKQPQKIKILFIGNQVPEFIKKIYTPDEFELTTQQEKQIDYEKLDRYQLIILFQNNLQNIDLEHFKNFVKNYGNLALIPDLEIKDNLSSFKLGLNKLSLPIENIKLDTTKVFLNNINFAHPFLKNVYTKKVKNFAYPSFNLHLKITPANHWLYKFNDQSPMTLLFKNNGKIFVFNTDLKPKHTNFSKSPYLIVPLFYQMAKDFENTQTSYYILGKNNSIYINQKLKKDELLKLKINDETIIPYQIIQPERVKITVDKNLKKAGFYSVLLNNKALDVLAFNYNRKENKLSFHKLPDLSNIHKINKINEFFNYQNSLKQETGLWKYFVLLSLLFLLFEFLIIKFWK